MIHAGILIKRPRDLKLLLGRRVCRWRLKEGGGGCGCVLMPQLIERRAMEPERGVLGTHPCRALLSKWSVSLGKLEACASVQGGVG